MPETTVIAADLGRSIAALTYRIHGHPAAIINVEARDDPTMRAQAAWALVSAGIDAGTILGALHGIRS